MKNEYTEKAMRNAPVFLIEKEEISNAYRLALKNLLEINTVPCPARIYNQTGLLEEQPGLMMRAGGTYPTPWTRDAAVNTMNAACFLEPEVAKNTLCAVCERADGRLCFQRDNQNWDKIIWAAGAWSYYLATADHDFLPLAYETVKNSMEMLESAQFNESYGMFTGGSFFNDGISGYPSDLHEEGQGSSFVGDHRPVKEVMTLSTNCLYYNAYRILEKMAVILEDKAAAQGYAEKGSALKAAMNRYLWREKDNFYSYLLYPDGRTDDSQEGCGISFAVLTGVCEKERAERMLRQCYRSERGLVSIWPPFAGISSVEKPLRHNNMIWPMVNGFFVTAAAQCGCPELVGDEIQNLALLIKQDNNSFSELYNPQTGEPDGGWQCGHSWESVRDQTWSATAFIRSIVFGVFGVVLDENEITFRPCLPAGFGTVALRGLRFREVEMDITLRGSGSQVEKLVIRPKEGAACGKSSISFAQPGHYTVEIELGGHSGCTKKMNRLPVTEIKPEGWLYEQLQIQMNGLSGKLYGAWESIGPDSGWLGGTGENWERAPYYLDGLIPLSYYLADREHWEICKKFMDWTLNSQTPDGNFGPEESREDYWSRYVMIKALIQYYEIEQDVRIIPFLKRYMRFLRKEMPRRLPESWSKARVPELLYGIKWLHEQTGEAEWVETARELDAYGLDWDALFQDFPFPRPTAYYYDWNQLSAFHQGNAEDWMRYDASHVVNVAMGLKHSALKTYFGISGEDDGMLHALEALQTLKKYHGVASGAINGDEHLSGSNPTQGSELCSVAEAMFSMETNLEAFGDPVFADYLERLAYNALPATITEDFMAHQYMQQANQVLVSNAKRNWFNNGEEANIYGLEPNYGCCTANMHQAWPKFVDALWLKEEDALVSMVYAPSSVRTTLCGEAFAVRLSTEYPFRDTLCYEIQEAPEQVVTLKLRIPGWCKHPQVNGREITTNAGFYAITKIFRPGEQIVLRLPMEIRFTHWYRDSVAVERGPLVYGLELEEIWSICKEHAGINDYEVRTEQDWNYALDLRSRPEYCEEKRSRIPFGRTSPACRLYLSAKKVPEWTMEQNSAGELPSSPVKTEEKSERISLIPFGCTKLRISQFPYFR